MLLPLPPLPLCLFHFPLFPLCPLWTPSLSPLYLTTPAAASTQPPMSFSFRVAAASTSAHCLASPPSLPADAPLFCEFPLPPSPSPPPVPLERRCPSSACELCLWSRAIRRLQLHSSLLVPPPPPLIRTGRKTMAMTMRRALSPSPPPSCSLVRTPAPLSRTRAVLPLS